MMQTTLALVALVGLLAAWLAWGIVTALRASWRLAGVRLVTCPETGTVAAVAFDRTHAAMTAVLHDGPDPRLSRCTRWPEREGCDQACLPQAEGPEAAVSNLMASWSASHRCALCGKPVSEDALVGHHVTLLTGGTSTTEWPDLPPETLPETLRASQPVCWNCHVAETFRRQHPELVVDR